MGYSQVLDDYTGTRIQKTFFDCIAKSVGGNALKKIRSSSPLSVCVLTSVLRLMEVDKEKSSFSDNCRDQLIRQLVRLVGITRSRGLNIA